MPRLATALAVYASYTALVAFANALASSAGGDESSATMLASGMLLGLVAIPVFSVIVPLWLARRWDLPRQWWPDADFALRAVALAVLYVFLASFLPLRALLESGVPPGRFAVHFVSAALFHVTYYPLFAVLLFPLWREVAGTTVALMATAALFAVYHLAQFYYFPAGTQPLFQFLLFASFIANLLLYLVTRSLMLAALAHSMNGAVALAGEGTWFDQVDAVFWIGTAILAGLCVYSLFDRPRQRGDVLWIVAARS